MSSELIDVTILTDEVTNDLRVIENKVVNIFHPPVNECKPSFITPCQYSEDPNCVKLLKLSQIRETLKFYKNSMVIPSSYSSSMKREAKASIKSVHDFTLMGTKQVLLNRLIHYLTQDLQAIQIQRMIRGVYVRNAIKLRGLALTNRKICVNDTDFYSLEPLENIPYLDFFSYTDDKQFTYGFEIDSLYAYLKRKSRRVLNPYNRDNMDKVVKDIRKLERLTKIINTHFVPEERAILIKTKVKPSCNTSRNSPTSAVANSSRTRRQQTTFHSTNYNNTVMIEHIRSIRNKPFIERARLLFMDIDQLGNYTQYQWFTELDRRNCLRFYRILRDIWTYRAQIPTSIKNKICPLWDPFIVVSNSMNVPELSLQNVLNICLSVMEDMVYTGIDAEYKTIGAFHVLTALTVVNQEARTNMPWLYESLVW
jgi:hypothetical protein